MKTSAEFMQFDATPYQRVPNVNTLATLALARALRERTPGEVPKAVTKEAARLDAVIAKLEVLFTDRRRDEDGPEYGAAVSFDAGTDRLWSTLYSNLQAWTAFEHLGFEAAVAAGGELGERISAGRGKAVRAEALLARLFGEPGLQPLRIAFHEQAEETAAIVRLIEEDGLEDELAKLVGPELVAAVLAAQPVYEQMAHDRLNGDNDEVVTRNQLKRELRYRIGRYSAQILATLDEEEPESLVRVTEALRPLVGLREELARRGRASSQADESDASAEPDDVESEGEADASGKSEGADEPAALEADPDLGEA